MNILLRLTTVKSGRDGFMEMNHLPEHLVEFVGSHAAAVISECEAKLTFFLHYVYPHLLGAHTWI